MVKFLFSTLFLVLVLVFVAALASAEGKGYFGSKNEYRQVKALSFDEYNQEKFFKNGIAWRKGPHVGRPIGSPRRGGIGGDGGTDPPPQSSVFNSDHGPEGGVSPAAGEAEKRVAPKPEGAEPNPGEGFLDPGNGGGPDPEEKYKAESTEEGASPAAVGAEKRVAPKPEGAEPNPWEGYLDPGNGGGPDPEEKHKPESAEGAATPAPVGAEKRFVPKPEGAEPNPGEGHLDPGYGGNEPDPDEKYTPESAEGYYKSKPEKKDAYDNHAI